VSERHAWWARVALAGVLLVPVGAGCGGGSSTPTLPTHPGGSMGGGGLPPPVGAMTRGPYLQHAETGVSVVWYTEAPSEGRVRWLLDDDTTGEAISSAGVATRHEAVIPSQPPGARCTYRVYSARGLLAGAAGTVDFSFQAPEPDVLRLVVFGDSGVGSADQHAVARAIGVDAVPPGLVMIVGDVSQPPASDAAYDSRFFAPYRSLLPAIPFYAAMGNHDYEVEAGKALLDVFTLPRNGPAGLAPESSYWLERAGVQMIVHDTNQTMGRLRDLSLPWHTETARRPADFRLVFQHHAMYSSGPNYERFPAGSLRALLGPLYTATGVDIVFSGHDHLYERTRPIGGVVYVTTGAGGAELYERQHTNAFTLAFANDRHSYTHVEVRGRTLLLRQTDTEGQTIDALAISKPVASSDALRLFSGTSAPPRGWEEPGFDDSRWAEAARTGFAAALHARRSFELARTGEVGEAVLRVRGARDFVVRLNGVPVARGGGGDDEDAAYPVPPTLLRTGANVLSLEGQVEGDEAAAPSLELSLFTSPAP
jgi:Calcineurin-like phosphoesterase